MIIHAETRLGNLKLEIGDERYLHATKNTKYINPIKSALKSYRMMQLQNMS
jgi:hypothetical protein